MMVLCAVFGCNSHNNRLKSTYAPNKRFFRFPVDPTVRDRWIVFTGQTSFNVNARVCSDHFKESDYNLNNLLKRGVVPSIQLAKHPRLPGDYEKRPLGPLYMSIDVDKDVKEFSSDALVTNESQVTNVISSETQTDPYNLNLERENDRLKRDNKMLLQELQLIEKAKLDLEYGISKIFTPSQIKKLINPKKKVHFSVDDISSSILLHSAGPHLYRLLRKRGYPFPSVSTLKVRHKFRRRALNVKTLFSIMSSPIQCCT